MILSGGGYAHRVPGIEGGDSAGSWGVPSVHFIVHGQQKPAGENRSIPEVYGITGQRNQAKQMHPAAIHPRNHHDSHAGQLSAKS
jgi:hypothetical protein